jgi:hypothetical protein
MPSPDASPRTGVIHRFTLLIEGLKRAMADGIGQRHATLGPLSVLLWNYLARTLRRLAGLHARVEAGTLAAAPRRNAAPRRSRSVRQPARLPRGPVLAQYYLGRFIAPLRELVEEPEMRALLAASPQVGRLLRPLWRRLTTDPLPEPLRLPRKPPRPAAEPGQADAAPATIPEPPPQPPPDPPGWRRAAEPVTEPPPPPPWQLPPSPA